MMAKPSFDPTPLPPLTITFPVVTDTPPQPRHRYGRQGGDRNTVRGERQSGASCQPGHHLIPALGAGGEDCRSLKRVGRALEDRGQGVRRKRVERVHVYGKKRLAELSGDGQRLPPGVAWLHQDQHAHSTPVFWSKSTTAVAAAAPLPSDSARRPCPAGMARLMSSRRGPGRDGVLTATGLVRARIFPGTDG